MQGFGFLAVSFLLSFFSLNALESFGSAYVTDDAQTVFVVDPVTGVATGTVSTAGFQSFYEPAEVAVSSSGTFAYITDRKQSHIYKVNTATNTVTGYVDKAGFASDLTKPNSIAISPDDSFGLVGDLSSKKIFKIDVPRSAVISELGSLGGGGFPISISISPDNSFAYLTNLDSNLYRIDLLNNAMTTIALSSPQSTDVEISNDGSFAYLTTNDLLGKIYKVDTATNNLTEVSGLTSSFTGIAISPGDQIVYVADNTNNKLLLIDPSTNTQKASIDISQPSVPAITADGKYLVVTAGSPSQIYQVDLSTNLVSLVTNSTGVPYSNPSWVATQPSSGKISLVGLVGNNKILAQYLNKYAPSSTKRFFSGLKGSELETALEMADPLRNVFATYSTQINQVALARLVDNYLIGLRTASFKMRFSKSKRTGQSKTKSSAANFELDQSDVIAANDDVVFNTPLGAQSTSSKSKKASQSNAVDPKINFWMSGFGEYFYDNPKHQTPSFGNISGGFVTACDYKIEDKYPVGAGFAYAHSSITQNEDFGKATANQESLFVYGSFDVQDFYFDTALWGGYYQLKNTRNISFNGYSDKANSKTHGWQFTPHLEFGYNYWINWFNMNPFTMADSVNNWESGFKENGAINLNMGQKGRYCTFLRSETGIRFQEVITYGWGNITVLEKASYAYQKAFGTGSITAFLVGSPGSFAVTTLTTAQNLGVAEVEARFNPNDIRYPYGSLGFHVEAGSMYQSYQGMAELGWKF